MTEDDEEQTEMLEAWQHLNMLEVPDIELEWTGLSHALFDEYHA